MPYSHLNHRDILAELLTWEHIGVASAGTGEDEKIKTQEVVEKDGNKTLKISESHLLGKYDKYMQDKENKNKVLHD